MHLKKDYQGFDISSFDPYSASKQDVIDPTMKAMVLLVELLDHEINLAKSNLTYVIKEAPIHGRSIIISFYLTDI